MGDDIESIILKKLDSLEIGQKEIEKNFATVMERIDQRDLKYSDQFIDIKEDVRKGAEGRKVLHKKQDEFEKKINEMAPTIDRVKSVFANIGKILWGFLAVILIGILLNSLPQIIEVLR